MSRILIEDIQINDYEIGWEGATLYTIKYSIEGHSRYFYNDSSCGQAQFFESEMDMTDDLLKISEHDNDEIQRSQDNIRIDDFHGVSLNVNYNEYPDLVNYLSNIESNEIVAFIRYIIALAICSKSDLSDLKEFAIGKYSDEIYVPLNSIIANY